MKKNWNNLTTEEIRGTKEYKDLIEYYSIFAEIGLKIADISRHFEISHPTVANDISAYFREFDVPRRRGYIRKSKKKLIRKISSNPRILELLNEIIRTLE